MIQLKPQQNSAEIKIDKSEVLNSRVSPWMANILYPVGCRIIIPLFFGQITIKGRENIPLKEPVIIAPTHRSRWDAFIVPYALGRPISGRDLRFMVSANEVKGLQGWVIKGMGGFPVNTDRPQLNSVRHSIEVLKLNREMLVIFPEGGIFNDSQVHPLKRGVALIALQAVTDQSQAGKILPVSINYSNPFPSWGTDVTVKIGKPLNVAQYLGKSLRRNSQELTAALENSLKNLHERPGD